VVNGIATREVSRHATEVSRHPGETGYHAAILSSLLDTASEESHE